MSNISKDVILQIKNLKLWFKVYQGYSKVLDGVNLTVHQGEKVGIVGEAGCGKTTTVKSILGIVPEGQYVIPEGEILYKGKDVLKMSDRDLGQVRSKEISMIYQEPSAALNPVFTIGQQMMEVVKNSAQGKGKSKAEQKQKKRTARYSYNPKKRTLFVRVVAIVLAAFMVLTCLSVLIFGS